MNEDFRETWKPEIEKCNNAIKYLEEHKGWEDDFPYLEKAYRLVLKVLEKMEEMQIGFGVDTDETWLKTICDVDKLDSIDNLAHDYVIEVRVMGQYFVTSALKDSMAYPSDYGEPFTGIECYYDTHLSMSVDLISPSYEDFDEYLEQIDDDYIEYGFSDEEITLSGFYDRDRFNRMEPDPFR